ncbi:hypothetical protein [Mycobacterium sp. FLAC0960]|uniref:Uncharacterized protein n=1 Tax=Mycobacterium colombiense TaxID=339268 RepID=A0A329LYM3_9MYCO|nr:hypothetical protein [Mycobacterium sp. FLAC0960]MDM4141522.1 hypothetical protein [Mycobacterium sp. FLAC0960]RAV12548.1 hypothetical protein DQP57_09450 [Mycobacterium colombiense]
MAISPTIMAAPPATAGAIGDEARSAVRPSTGEARGGCGRRSGLGRGGAAEQQRAGHSPGTDDTCGRAA